jgi:hypothetical protein
VRRSNDAADEEMTVAASGGGEKEKEKESEMLRFKALAGEVEATVCEMRDEQRGQVRWLTHADVCWRMLTYAGVCCRMLTHADVCWRMLAYADVC